MNAVNGKSFLFNEVILPDFPEGKAIVVANNLFVFVTVVYFFSSLLCHHLASLVSNIFRSASFGSHGHGPKLAKATSLRR